MASVPQHWHLYIVALAPRVRIPAGVCGLIRDSDILADQMMARDNTLLHRDRGPVPESARNGA